MNAFETFLWGLLGALAMELVGIYRLYKVGKPMPPRYGSILFWLIRGWVMVCGGAVAVGYSLSGLTISSLLAVNLGATTPLLLAELVQLAPEPESEAGASLDQVDKSGTHPRSRFAESWF
jgi:hypothetical protein